jgi:hypothetical protein
MEIEKWIMVHILWDIHINYVFIYLLKNEIENTVVVVVGHRGGSWSCDWIESNPFVPLTTNSFVAVLTKSQTPSSRIPTSLTPQFNRPIRFFSSSFSQPCPTFTVLHWFAAFSSKFRPRIHKNLLGFHFFPFYFYYFLSSSLHVKYCNRSPNSIVIIK